MREPLVAILTLKRLFSRVDPLVLLQVMFEFESLATVAAFEFAQVWSVLMVGQDFMSCKHRAQLYRKQPSKSRFAKVLFIFNVIFKKKVI